MSVITKVMAPAPLFRDPIYDGPTDPTIIWNKEEKHRHTNNNVSNGDYKKLFNSIFFHKCASGKWIYNLLYMFDNLKTSTLFSIVMFLKIQ